MMDDATALATARDAFTGSTTYFDSSIRPQVNASIRQFQGVHPAGSKYHSEAYKSRSNFYRPKTRSTIRKNEASAAEAFFSTNKVVSCEPADEDNPMSHASAQVMQLLLAYRLRKSIPWFLTCIGAYQDAQTVGVCISHQYWRFDPRKGIDKPCIDLIPIENLRIDAGASWVDPINTSPYVIRMIPMYVKDVRARMQADNEKTGEAKWLTLDASQILTAIQAYGDTTRLTRERGRTDSKEQQNAISDFAMVWVHQNIVEIDGQDLMYYTLSTVGLLSRPKPLEEAYLHGKRPFTMGFCLLETHKNYPEGVAGVTKDIAREINELANARADNVKFAMNKRYFGKRGAQIDLRSLTRNVPGSVTLMNDPESDVKVVETKDVTRSAYEEQDRLNLDFDDVSGSFSNSSVQSNRKLNETVGGLQLLNANTNQVGSYQLRVFVETWVIPTLSQLILLERHYETDDVILALAAAKARLFERFGQNDVTDKLLMKELDLNVSVGIGATSPQEQINNFMAGMKALRDVLADGLLERYGLKVTEVIEELFGKLGFSDGKRFFDTDKEDPALTNAKATILQLQQELAQKVRPEMVAAQVKKLDAEIEALSVKNRAVNATAVETTMRTLFASGQTAQMIAAVPALAPLMDALAQLAGYTEPVPAGIDPNIPAPAGPAAGITQNSVKDPRTGTEFTPGNVIAGPGGAMPGDTTPGTPALPTTGAEHGIQTIRSPG